MSTNESPDPTTQIVGAFERMAVPPAPSVQATIELLRRRAPAELEAHERAEIAQVAWKRFFNQGRELMRRPIPRMIAATAAGLMAFVVWSQFPDRQPEAQALEEIAKAIVAARTATFDTTIHVEGMPEQTAHCYFLAPGKSRTESKASVPDALIPEARHGKSQDNEIEFVVIADKQSGKSMLLSAAQKTATITHTLNQPAAMRADGMQIFEQMRDLLSKSPDATGKWLKPLGEKEIDGIRVLGFRCEAPNVSMTLWGDPKTGLPVLVETKVTKPMPMESTMSHFKLNVELKPELFDMTPPEGYTVRTTEIDASPATEESLVKMFALSARLNGNQFFDNLDRTSQLSLMKKQVEKMNPGRSPELEKAFTERVQTIQRGLSFAWFLKPAADAHYAGKGIRRNEPDRPIFWYKPEGSDKYRVIYATLAIRNATTPPDVPGAVRVEMPTIDPKADMERVKAENEAFKAWGQAVIKSVPHGEDIIALETLKTLADAMRAAYDDKDRFPGDICDASGKPLLSWRVRLLPYLGKEELYNQFRLDEPWDSKHNRRASIRMPSIYHTPMKGVPHGKTAFLAPNGKGTIFEDQRWLDPKQIADGADSTILLVTADVEHAVPWTKPEDLAIDPVNPALGLRHGHGHFVVAAADGSVWRLPDDLEPARLWGFFSAGGGEKVVWPIATQWPGSDVFFAPKEP